MKFICHAVGIFLEFFNRHHAVLWYPFAFFHFSGALNLCMVRVTRTNIWLPWIIVRKPLRIPKNKGTYLCQLRFELNYFVSDFVAEISVPDLPGPKVFMHQENCAGDQFWISVHLGFESVRVHEHRPWQH